MDSDVATLKYRLDRLDDEQEKLAGALDHLGREVAVHDEQISGAGGIVKAVERLGGKVDSLNKALYAFAGSFIVAAITIAVAIQQAHG